MGNARQDFSKRLAEAMQARGYAPRPGVLHKLFNSHYHGRSVAFSSVSKWLRGTTLPDQEKLEVLAAVLEVEPQVLRFGGTPRRVADSRLDWGQMTVEDAAACTAYLKLPPRRRALVRELLKALSESVGA